MRLSSFAIVGFALFVVGCGGSVAPVSTASLAGNYNGSWTKTQGGPFAGTATVAISTAGATTFVLNSAVLGMPASQITGSVAANGSFQGQLATDTQPQTVTGTIQVSNAGVLTAVLSHELTPGAPTTPEEQWYVTANKQ